MKMDVDTSSTEDAVITMTRIFDAPRDVVWLAFTDPRHVAKWYGGHGFENPVCEMDVRPGGLWRHTMRFPDGTEHSMEFVYVEVVKPEKLVWQNVDHGKRKSGPPTCVNTVTLEEHGKQTKWKLVARFDSFADRDAAARSGFTTIIAQGSERLVAVAKEIERSLSCPGDHARLDAPAHLSMYAMAVETFIPMLRTLSNLLDKGARYARDESIDPSTLVEGRLAPDMYTLALQVRLACDHAQNGTALLVGREPPRPQLTDPKTIDDLKARIGEAIAYLESVPAPLFDGSANRDIELPLHSDLVLTMKGARFLRDWALPHFYFHIVTAYDILRHLGVEIGKRDYLAHIGDAIRPRKAS